MFLQLKFKLQILSLKYGGCLLWHSIYTCAFQSVCLFACACLLAPVCLRVFSSASRNYSTCPTFFR